MAKDEHNVWRLLGTRRHGKAWGSLLALCGRCHHKGQGNSVELAERMALSGRPSRPKCFLAKKGGRRPPDATRKVSAPLVAGGQQVVEVEECEGGRHLQDGHWELLWQEAEGQQEGKGGGMARVAL